ncbi:MAG: hypothetical protein ACK5MV_10845 [Aminipila sp.]
MSRSNSSKSQLFLMEFICVVMFFALSAALCVSAFVKADTVSKNGRNLNEALFLAQTVAETIKAMDNPNEETIGQAVKTIQKEKDNDLVLKVENNWEPDMLISKVYVYESVADLDKKEICDITIKKYLPNGETYGEQ